MLCRSRALFFAFLTLFVTLPCLAQEITVTPLKPGGVFKTGETIRWRLGLTGEGTAEIEKISYVLKKGGLTEIAHGDLTLKDHEADFETKLDEPGTLLAEFSVTIPGKPPIKNEAGAVIDPNNIKPSAPAPDDFDAFWKAKVAELAAVPLHPLLETGESGNSAVDYWKISLDNIRGTRVQGQLARPKAGTRLPALLIVQWAGVYPLARDWAVGRALNGWLTLNINAHDLPIDRPTDYYQQLTDLKNYPAIGNEDRETSYFLRMYLSCYRAIEYLMSRDDWDGKTLVVIGTSQGGLQSLMLGGLHPKITAVLANVPAGCDETGPLVGRQPGWPMWYYQTKEKDKTKVIETSKYYDVVNFARRITCPTLVAVGLIDITCPPAGVIAAFNQVRGPKELVVMERSDHQGRNNTQAPFHIREKEWLKRLLSGQTPPVAP